MLRELERVVDGREKHVYFKKKMGAGPACTYERYRKPSCLVGHVLYNLGLEPKQLRKLDNLSVPGILGCYTQATLRDMGINLTKPAVRALHEAQLAQDSGLTWGEALEGARRVR